MSVLPFTRVQLAVPLVSLTEAKDFLKERDPAHDAEVLRHALDATNVVLDYLKAGADPAWTDTTVPHPVRAAVLKMLWFLYRHDPDPQIERDVWVDLDQLLARFRDPAVA